MQAQLEEQRKLNSSVQKQTSRSLDSFRSDLEARKESVEQLREASSASASVLELLFSEIESIFSLFKRSNPSIIRLLGKVTFYMIVHNLTKLVKYSINIVSVINSRI